MGFIGNRSKTLSMIATGVCLSATAFAGGPQVYGLLNKEVRTFSQDAGENKVSSINITDVDGFETRIGVKGTHSSDKHNMDYKIELGLNSDKDSDSTTEALRMRLAFVKMNKSWGSLTFGQNWTPNSVRMIQLDPFSGTGLQSYGLDQKFINGANAENQGLGFRLRYFKDQFTFQSKDMSGFKYALTYDRDNKGAANGTTNDSTYTTHMITWDKDFGSFKNNLTITSSSQGFDKASTTKEKFTQIGNKMMFSNQNVSLGYGTQEDSGGKNKRMFVGYSFMKDKSTYAFSYSNLAEENTAGTKLGSDTLMSLGWFHKCSDMITTRLTVGQYTVAKEVATDFDSVGGTDGKENKGTIIALGAMVKF